MTVDNAGKTIFSLKRRGPHKSPGKVPTFRVCSIEEIKSQRETEMEFFFNVFKKLTGK